MKAMVLRKKNEPFVLEERPDPAAGPSEAVARVLACGSGLTIHHARAGRGNPNYPIIIGHEVLGEIVETGAGVEDLKPGDIVTLHGYLSCGRCRWCRIDRESLCDNLGGFVGRHVDGGYAEYIKLPACNFIPVPPGIDYKNRPAEAAVICDAVTTPLKVLRRARIAPLETVAVFGAGGGLGIHMIMLARWAHARVIAVDIMPAKLSKCREVGAEGRQARGRLAEHELEERHPDEGGEDGEDAREDDRRSQFDHTYLSKGAGQRDYRENSGGLYAALQGFA